MSLSPLTAERLRGIALSTLITAGFAAGWGVGGSLALPGVARTLALLVVLAVTTSLLAVAFRLFRHARSYPGASGAEANPFRSRPYQLAVLAEIVAIPLAGWLLTRAGRPDTIISAVAAIVGLHFFGLVPAFRSRLFALLGGAMVLLALLSLALPPTITIGPSDEQLGLRAAVVDLGSAVILWAGSVPILTTTLRQSSRAGPLPADRR